jgi:tetratricopeptide (TPR) repeat protein
MDYILENFSDYDDETIIQMIDACVDLGIIDWIKEYKAEIQKKCLYPETFLYELAQEADASGDTKYASKILEELTNLVPFNSGYWFMLSQYYLMLGEYDNALNAIDYALAIDPKSVEMRLRRIHILYLINDDRSQAEHLLLNLISEYPDNLDVMTSYVSLLVMGGHREMAAEVLLRYIKQQPGNRDLINSMINLELKDFSEKALDIYYDQGSKDPNEWMTWASSYYDADQPRQCADILLAFLRNDCNGIANYALLFETLYTSSEHQEICRIYDELNASGAIEHTSLTPIEFLYIALSMMYLGRTAEARDLSAKQLIELKAPSCGNAKERMVDNTLRDTFEKIIYVVDENQDINICDIDPFT